MTHASKIVPCAVRKVIVLGCYPPRRCGIATFTLDTVTSLRAADPDLEVHIIAMDDGLQTPDMPGGALGLIKQHELGTYIEAAATINAEKPDCLLVQHEFGIYGGVAGEFLLTLLSLVQVPVITFLHTVLERPDHNQSRVMRRLIHRSARVVVMAKRGSAMLKDVYGAAPGRVAIIQHGAPARAYEPAGIVRARLGIVCERMISTFGLLSPNKGIEHVIRAMPDVVACYPSARYVVLGVTHPHILAREGETYRRFLEELAVDLGVSENVVFENRFVGNEELFDILQASDVYATPYLNEAQITSGTLSYALAMGCYVVSTPYWHAREVMDNCPGTLVPAEDSGAIRLACLEAFGNPDRLEALRIDTHAWAEHTHWPEFGARLSAVMNDVIRVGARITHISERRGPAFPTTALKAVERMTDNCGIFQHSRFAVPDRHHGYCVDDNARALIMTNNLFRSGMGGADIERLHSIYASFVVHAVDEVTGQIRNFMGYDRRWIPGVASEDSQGRAFWALGHAAATVQYPGNAGWGATLLQSAIAEVEKLTSPRARAFVILGCAELAEAGLSSTRYDAVMYRFAEELLNQFAQCRGEDWDWLEDTLSYDNGRIPQALLVAARLSGNQAGLKESLASLDWLCEAQLIDHGMFAPVGSDSFGRVRQPPLPYDQQPIEAAAMLDACYQAFLVGREEKWWRRARTIFAWFYGLNTHEISLVDPATGLCHDGLNKSGLNLNAGAESLLAFQMSVWTYQAFLAQIDETPRREQPIEPLWAARR